MVLAIMSVSAISASAQVLVKYHGEVNAGYSLGVGTLGLNRANVNTIQGIQVGNYVTTGLGLGLDWYHGQKGVKESDFIMPIYLNVKGYLPVNETFAPYLTFDVGYGVGVSEYTKGYGGLYLTPGVGVKCGKFKAEIGFNMQRLIDVVSANTNAFKFLIGCIF